MQTVKELAIRDKFGSNLKLQNPERDRSSDRYNVPVRTSISSFRIIFMSFGNYKITRFNEPGEPKM